MFQNGQDVQGENNALPLAHTICADKKLIAQFDQFRKKRNIGGYQVCYKWLYDRKQAGRKLSKNDIDHYHKIVVALSETIRIMKEIDEVIEAHGGWPIK